MSRPSDPYRLPCQPEGSYAKRKLDQHEGGALLTKSRGSLNVSTLEGWLWDAACQVRGPLDAPKFKDYILPLIFLKRLSDVFEDEVKRLALELGDEEIAAEIIEQDRTMVRFYVPGVARWHEIRQKTTGLAEHLTDA